MLLLVLLLAQAEPSALACTFESALAGQSCVYEAEPAAGDARDNSKAASAAGARLCDAAVRSECEWAVAEASLGPKCALPARLADAKGRLTPQAQECVEALRVVISRASRAASHAACCTCLAEARCAVPAAQCRNELAELSPGAALSACLAKSCHDRCPF